MEHLNIQISINSDSYIKDPNSSELGKNILTNGIILIHQLGFESFNFKKLGNHIHSPESSIYRYFKNKHMLLSYLTIWYWSWIEYKLSIELSHISNPKEQLIKSLEMITDVDTQDNTFPHIDEVLLNKIMTDESAKTYYTKDVGSKNKKGHFTVYKRVVQRVSDIIIKINPDFEYAHTLISTIIEGSHQQRYFAKHLPELTDLKKDSSKMTDFFTKLVLKTITPNG